MHELVWVDRRWTRLGTVGEPAVQHRLAISADGRTVAVERPSRQGTAIWKIEVPGGAVYFADRSADGTQLVVGIADRRGRFVNVVPVSGGAPVPVVGGSGIGLGNARISSDGRWLAYESRQTGRSDIYVTAHTRRS